MTLRDLYDKNLIEVRCVKCSRLLRVHKAFAGDDVVCLPCRDPEKWAWVRRGDGEEITAKPPENRR